MTKFTTIFTQKEDDLWLWSPVIFGFGVSFYLSFSEGFSANWVSFAFLLVAAIMLVFLNRNHASTLVLITCVLFLLGSFYADFYQKFFLNHSKITGKIYVDAVGKIKNVKNFFNPANGLSGANLLISSPILYRAKFSSDDQKISKKTKKHKKKKSKKTAKKKSKSKSDGSYKSKTKRPKENKPKKPISARIIQKNFLNLRDYQEIDRKFLDYSKNYQSVEWLKINGREVFPNPPPKISVNLIKNFQNLAVNDVVAMRLLLQPAAAKDFSDDFDFSLDAKSKKIGAFGFVLGEVEILQKSEISSVDQWFNSLREKIAKRILTVTEGEEGAIALAFLIGDQSKISKGLTENIRNSGLAHLLSISGFHLALAGAIFFTATRFLLSRSEYMILHFDLKKIAAFTAALGTYFYLKIAGSPIPAQRAFLMVLLVLVALFVNQKLDLKRAIMTAALALILLNPYVVFNISFQLSFTAVLVLAVFYEESVKLIGKRFYQGFFPRIFWYFLEIVLLSILIEVATLPFFLKSFQNAVMLGFVANILAIPLASFLIMPSGFLAIFLMPFELEKYPLLLMQEGILLVKKIAIFVAGFDYSHFATPKLSNFGFVVTIFGLLLICLIKSRTRFLGLALFFLGLSTIFFTKKPDILFDSKQKFFALYDSKDGLIFSKNLRPSKRRDYWMKRMGENEFKSLENFSLEWKKERGIFCDQEKCLLNRNQRRNKKILVLLARNKISEICRNDFDAIVNLTAKYQLPNCILKNKIKIDNSDFYYRGGQFLFLN